MATPPRVPRRGVRPAETPVEEDAASRRAPSTPGEILRAARLRRRLSLAEAEQGTRIRQQYLQALEDDDYGTLPAGVYSRGFLRNYAIFLGVAPDEVMSGVPERRARERRPGLRAVSRPVRIRVPRATWALALAALAVLLVVASLAWLGLTAPEEQGAPAAAPATSPTSLVTLPPLAPPATATAPAPAAAPPAQPPAAPAAPPTPSQRVEVELRTVDRSWVRATVDGRVVLEDTLAAGQLQRWVGQQSVLLRVGNAGGVDVTVNGQRIGPLGPAGQPADREFNR